MPDAQSSPWQGRRRWKRTLDLAVLCISAPIVLPVTGLVALAVLLTLGRPVLFRQLRPGFRERPFLLLKFRTMRSATRPDGTQRPDGERLTHAGALLRRASLDELPTLINVFRGEMSLVGPRPLLMRYLPWFTDQERLRFSVPPGITGLAQINGRNLTSWTERLAQDVAYVEAWSLTMDCRILLRTIPAVLGGKGVVPDAQSAMPDLDQERTGFHRLPEASSG